MIFNQVIKGGGSFASIIVTAPTGSTVTCNGTSVAEVSGTWTFSGLCIGTYTIYATKDGLDYSQDVLVDAVAVYQVQIYYYATQDMICWLDGVWNSGVGTHKNNLTRWEDLSGNENHGTIVNSVTVNNDNIITTGNGYITVPGNVISNDYYYEMVYRMNDNLVHVWMSANAEMPTVWNNSGTGLAVYAPAGHAIYGNIKRFNVDNIIGDVVSLGWGGKNPSTIMINGSSVSYSSAPEGIISLGGENKLMLGLRGSNNAHYENEYYCFRVYSRNLTPAEKTVNYNTDRVRFNLT